MIERAKDVLTKKIGPLPLVAWVGIGAAVLLVLRLRSGGGGGFVGQPGFGVGGANLPGGGSRGLVGYSGVQGGSGADPLGPALSALAAAAPAPAAPSPELVTAGPSVVVPTSSSPSLTALPVTATGGYRAPSLNPSSLGLSGGSVYASPSTPGFAAPFIGPTVSTVSGFAPSYDPYHLAGQLPAGAQLQLVGGVPISLSSEAVAREAQGQGIAARDIPLAPAAP